jgi:DNA-binding MurR/RpiR family transcriptional regulator
MDGPPKDFQALRAEIAGRAGDLPRRLMQVASYALDNPDEIAFGTVASIAADADVQPSALVRFSHALGYQGFTEFQEVFRSRLRDRVPGYGERLRQLREHGIAGGRSGQVLDGFLAAAEESVARFRERVDHAGVERAVATLAKAETIYLIGLRRSFPVTSYMSYAMGQLSIRNVLVDGLAGMGAEQAGFMAPGDAAVVVSFAPYAGETVALARRAGERGVEFVAITDSVFSPVAAAADVMIEVGEADFEGFRSLAATMALAMALAVAVAGRRAEREQAG